MALSHLLADPCVSLRPHRQHHILLGMYPDSDDEDLLSHWTALPRKVRRAVVTSPYYRSLKSSGKPKRLATPAKVDKDHFKVNVDVQQFTPDEITVKATGEDTITVEAKHEERPDEHGSIYRHFIRRYVLPKGHDIEKVQSSLSSDGVLTITAPKIDTSKAGEREIPVIQTCKPTVTSTSTEDGSGDKPEGDNKKK